MGVFKERLESFEYFREGADRDCDGLRQRENFEAGNGSENDSLALDLLKSLPNCTFRE